MKGSNSLYCQSSMRNRTSSSLKKKKKKKTFFKSILKSFCQVCFFPRIWYGWCLATPLRMCSSSFIEGEKYKSNTIITVVACFLKTHTLYALTSSSSSMLSWFRAAPEKVEALYLVLRAEKFW